MKIAIAGIRGVPACYGGFETFAEELGSRLATRGHTVIVYGRKHVIQHPSSTYRGMELVLLPAPRHKYLETPLHTLLSIFHLVFHRPDVTLVCNAANSPFLWILRLVRIPVAVNLDGIERLRAKWNLLGKLWYRCGEICSVLFANKLVADAEVIREYYEKTYNTRSVVIRYGYADGGEERDTFARIIARKINGEEASESSSGREQKSIFETLPLRPGAYLLYVSRLEPENNAHRVIEAYEALPASSRKIPLVIVGGAPYAKEYIHRLHSLAGEQVMFLGFRFGSEYRELQLGAYAYIQATEVGGTHPALVEAMGFANCVIANKTPENMEVLGDAGICYEKNNVRALTESLAQVLADFEMVKRYRKLAYERATRNFNWENITSDYEALFSELTGR